MMDWTDRHCRYFHRLLTRHSLLYTEMVTASALKFGPRQQLLHYHASEHPLALQLGGSDPQLMSEAAVWGSEAGYDEININVGCPSDRVQSGRFGACLMAEPALVASCIRKMKVECTVPITVKTRIGIDRQTSFDFLWQFVEPVVEAGCDRLIIHARAAWLDGLSPAENRTIPPLSYDTVYALKQRLPHIPIMINGGIQTMTECMQHLQHVDGVMMGREAYQNPYVLAAVDTDVFGDASTPPPTRAEVLEKYLTDYVALELQQGTPLNALLKPVLGLYHAQRGGKKFRQIISQQITVAKQGAVTMQQVLDALHEYVV